MKRIHKHRQRGEGRGGAVREPGKLVAGPPGLEAGGDRPPAGTLYVVATPIGNLEDITIRAIRILKEVRLIAAEDTRRTRILLDRYQIETPLISLYDQNELKKSGLLLARLQGGDDVAYVSDAGTPGISDPGYILVREALASGISVVPVPGASALIAAISVSGLPMDTFVFYGFLPSKPTKRRQLLLSLQGENRTLIFYESPHRLLDSLKDIAELLGERDVVLSREMTKLHEEFFRGPADAVMARLGEGVVKGEVTLIVAGCPRESPEYTDDELLERCEQLKRTERELSLRDRADRIARETGVSRRRIYRLLLFP